MLALFRIANGKPEDAEPYLKQYAQTLKDTDSKLVLADYYLDRGRSKDALPLLHELASDTSAQRAIELRLARLDIQEGRRREARGRLNTLFRLDSQDPSTLILEGQLLSAEQKIAQAIVTLRGAVRISPQSAKSEFDLGRAYLAKNDPEEAIKAFTETLRLNPMAAAAELELSRLELTRERPENTVQSVKSSGGKVKRNPTVELTRVRALVAKGDLQQADDEIQVLLAKYPDYVSLFMQAGIVADLKGDRERAARWFSNALGLYDGYQEAFSALIALDLSHKDPATAIARVEGRLKGSPNNTEMLLLAARVYESVGNLGKSEQVLQRTIEIDASKLQAYEMLARQYRSQKRTDEALKQLDERSKQEPPTVQAHTLAAMLLEAQHRTREARKRYELALTLDPKAAVAATRLAWIYAETGGNLDTALQLARTAARGLPDSAPVEDTLGWIYYKKGLAALAIPSFQKSVDQDPANPVYASHLALAQAKMDGKY
jgi:tetratricopeptide (TPR) repeat protein